jgi:hypothetical protein
VCKKCILSVFFLSFFNILTKIDHENLISNFTSQKVIRLTFKLIFSILGLFGFAISKSAI